MKFKKGMPTPWGPVQWSHEITEGVVTLGTAGHGGIWLSEEKSKKLPPEYKPFTRSNTWAEEDEDGALVLQYLGLLSLVKEDLMLEITDIDILIGKKTRLVYCGSPYHGGPIAEAYKRQTGDLQDSEMICANDILSPRPGGFKLGRLSKEAQAFMAKIDANEQVEPTTVKISPYVVHLPKEFKHTLNNGKSFTERVSGTQAHKVLLGDQTAIDNYVQFRSYFPDFEKVQKIAYGGQTIYQRNSP